MSERAASAQSGRRCRSFGEVAVTEETTTARRCSKETALLPFYVNFPEVNFKGEKTR
jgi:hypothetical protein